MKPLFISRKNILLFITASLISLSGSSVFACGPTICDRIIILDKYLLSYLFTLPITYWYIILIIFLLIIIFSKSITKIYIYLRGLVAIISLIFCISNNVSAQDIQYETIDLNGFNETSCSGMIYYPCPEQPLYDKVLHRFLIYKIPIGLALHLTSGILLLYKIKKQKFEIDDVDKTNQLQ